MSQAKEQVFHLKGQKIAAKIWNPDGQIPTLALHGWLDNAASFDRLAPLLPDHHIVAIDLPGHGHSDHKPPGTFIHIIDFVVNAIQVTHHLGWERYALLGHSLGAAIACIIAGTLPTHITDLVLIDGLGPYTTSPDNTPLQLQSFIHQLMTKPDKSPPRYADQEEALNARLKVTPMLKDSAQLLLKRGLKKTADGTWTWRTDPMLLMPSAIQLTEEQLLAFLEHIDIGICLIRPEPGYPFPMDIIKRRLIALKQVEIFRLEGDHHIHLDAPQQVADSIHQFHTSSRPI